MGIGKVEYLRINNSDHLLRLSHRNRLYDMFKISYMAYLIFNLMSDEIISGSGLERIVSNDLTL